MVTAVTIIQYVAIAFLAINLYYSIIQRPSGFQIHAILLTLATTLLFIGYNFEITATTQNDAFDAVFISYIGKPFVLMETFMLTCEFYGKKVNSLIYGILGLICLSFPILVFTNNYHHIYYKTVEFDRSQIFSPLKVTHGPYYYVFIAMCIVFIAGCIGLTIGDMIQTRKTKVSSRRKRIRICVLLVVACEVSGYALYLVDFKSNYDPTMIGAFFSVVVIMIMFFRFKVFDAITVANTKAMDDSSVGLVVYDESQKISYANNLGKQLMSNEKINKKIRILKSIGEVEFEDKYYQLTPHVFLDNGMDVGRSVEIKDITYEKKYQDVLKKEVRERTEKIEKIQRIIIESFADMIESRSLETGDHIKRTSSYAKLIAEEMRKQDQYTDVLTDDYIELLTLATPLHDIGKISIPDAVLLKPGRLTPEEFEIMKAHSENGSVLIEKALRNVESNEFIEIAKDIAQFHHERWDGTGYPAGLKGTEIPLSSRIVALADTFDALTSPRCYKASYPISKAISIIEEETGTHFDPSISKIFVTLIKEKYNIK